MWLFFSAIFDSIIFVVVIVILACTFFYWASKWCHFQICKKGSRYGAKAFKKGVGIWKVLASIAYTRYALLFILHFVHTLCSLTIKEGVLFKYS